MKLPHHAHFVAALALTVVMSGCSGAPTPAPRATPLFATEEEAFAAAEETYRAYVDALNRVDLSDPETFEDVFAWTTGELHASDRENLTQMHANGQVKSGTSSVGLVELNNVDDEAELVELAVCLDVSQVEVVDASGVSMVDPDRVDVQTLLVTVVPDTASESGLAIARVAGREGAPAC